MDKLFNDGFSNHNAPLEPSLTSIAQIYWISRLNLVVFDFKSDVHEMPSIYK